MDNFSIIHFFRPIQVLRLMISVAIVFAVATDAEENEVGKGISQFTLKLYQVFFN